MDVIEFSAYHLIQCHLGLCGKVHINYNLIGNF